MYFAKYAWLQSYGIICLPRQSASALVIFGYNMSISRKYKKKKIWLQVPSSGVNLLAATLKQNCLGFLSRHWSTETQCWKHRYVQLYGYTYVRCMLIVFITNDIALRMLKYNISNVQNSVVRLVYTHYKVQVIQLHQWRSQGMAEYGSCHPNLRNLAN